MGDAVKGSGGEGLLEVEAETEARTSNIYLYLSRGIHTH